jgi:hypothetical protein
MAKNKRSFIPNQVFLGLPWKNVRAKYERAIIQLEKKYPIHFSIVGRDDGHDADDLFEVIKQRIAKSSYAIFDATGGNANVSLEFGYAEGIQLPKAIFLSTHKAAQKNAGAPIISDLGGKKRSQYKTDSKLQSELRSFCKNHDYTKRFERGLSTIYEPLPKGQKKRKRSLALKLIHILSGVDEVKRDDVVQRLQAKGYTALEAGEIIRELHSVGLIECKVGRYSSVRVA